MLSALSALAKCPTSSEDGFKNVFQDVKVKTHLGILTILGYKRSVSNLRKRCIVA